MAQGDIITPEVEQIIADVWRNHVLNGWTAKEIQSEVAKQVQERWQGRYKQDWPGLRAVQARLPKIKDKYNSEVFQELAAPWHMGTLEKYPQPTEAIADILRVQAYTRGAVIKKVKNTEQMSIADLKLLRSGLISIREAKWICRLSGLAHYYQSLYEQGKLKKITKTFDFEFWLWSWSRAYAKLEIISYLSGVSCDTTTLDQRIMQYPISAIPYSDHDIVKLKFRSGHEEIILKKDGGP